MIAAMIPLNYEEPKPREMSPQLGHIAAGCFCLGWLVIFVGKPLNGSKIFGLILASTIFLSFATAFVLSAIAMFRNKSRTFLACVVFFLALATWTLLVYGIFFVKLTRA